MKGMTNTISGWRKQRNGLGEAVYVGYYQGPSFCFLWWIEI